MLTANSIRSLRPRSGPYRVADKAVQGFGVHVSPAGHKSYVLSIRQRTHSGTRTGRRMYYKVGDVNLLSLADARRAATELRAKLAIGVDPRTPPPVVATVRELLAAYIRYLEANGRPSAKENHRLFEHDAIPLIGDRQASSITPDDIAAVVRVAVRRGSLTVATRLRGALGAAFSWAIKSQYDPLQDAGSRKFGVEVNPVLAVPKPIRGTVSCDRFLDEAEAKLMWKHLHEHGGSTLTNALKLMLATGQRVREVSNMRWDQLEPIVGGLLWTLPTTKNGRPHEIPLVGVALDIINEMRPLSGNCEVVFPQRYSLKTAINATSLNNLVTKLCRATGQQMWSPRDLRRTMKTLAVKHGISKVELDRLQNHAMSDVSSRHYVKYNYLKEKTKTMRAWNAVLQNILG